MNILFRVDAHAEIALGHLNRCINLAESLIEHGHSVFFISYNDPAAKSLLSKTRFEYQLIPFKINDLKDKFGEFSILEKISNKINLILVDSYNVDKNYFFFLKNNFRYISYLDDMNLNFDVDLVINPSCTLKKDNYMAKNILSGIEYVILGKEYSKDYNKIIKSKINTMLITLGGVDHYNISSRCVPIIENISPDIELNIIIGPYYDNVNLIKDVAKNSSLKINLIENTTNILPIILKSDIALTAGGFTSFELAALATPSIGIALWKNQYKNIDCLSREGALIPLYYPKIKNFDKALSKEIYKLIYDEGLMINMSKKAKEIVDGKGSDRISTKITEFYEEK